MDKYTTQDFEKEFPTDDSCLEWIKNYLWPDGIFCPECEEVTKHHKVTGRQCYACDYCGHQVHPLANTIFRKSATPLRIWFQVIYRMASTRCGISAKQIQRETGVTYKTAWRMFKQIRTLFGENFQHLTGEVEVDETYMGGMRKGKRGRGAEGKTKVIGAAQRNGKVVAKVVPDVRRHTIVPFTVQNVDRNAVLFTDEFPSYDTMARVGYNHLRISHHDKEYVRGKIHTNSIEGFWSLVKRGISGVYHSVSPQYLQSYINEYAFRYNHRKDKVPMFKLVLGRIRAW
jgi:transposase-like protein